jgi:hypothetical protein
MALARGKVAVAALTAVIVIALAAPVQGRGIGLLESIVSTHDTGIATIAEASTGGVVDGEGVQGLWSTGWAAVGKVRDQCVAPHLIIDSVDVSNARLSRLVHLTRGPAPVVLLTAGHARMRLVRDAKGRRG